MLSEKYRPKSWTDFAPRFEAACTDSWLFDGGGERWLFESDGIAGCGKTTAACTVARALGCADFAIQELDSRSTTVSDLRALEVSMQVYSFGPTGRKAYLERIASDVGLTVPDGFNMLGYVQGKMRHTPMDGNNIRAAIDGLPDALRRFGGVSVAA